METRVTKREVLFYKREKERERERERERREYMKYWK